MTTSVLHRFENIVRESGGSRDDRAVGGRVVRPGWALAMVGHNPFTSSSSVADKYPIGWNSIPFQRSVHIGCIA